jgi:hypothetical protein
MHNQNTAPQGAAQAFAHERARRKYSWLHMVKRKLRTDHGREACKRHNVCPRLVAELADEISGYPSFKEHGEVWVGQQRLGLRLGVQDRQVRRAVGALCELDLLRVERERGRGNTNNMAALLHGRPLFEPNSVDDRSSASPLDGTGVSSNNRTWTSSNTDGEEAQKYTSPVGPSNTRRRETPMAKEEKSNFDQLISGAGCSQDDPRPSVTKSNSRKTGYDGAVGFAQLMRVYPHPRGQREHDAYEPAARLAWAALSDAQRAEALKAAPHAPGKSWLKHWLNDARETGIFDTVKQATAGPRVWVSEGTRQHAAWAEHYRSSGRRLPTTQHRIDGELRTGWMFESEWPPNFNFVQRDGGAA